MSEMYAHVSVKILEKEYQISCLASERNALLDSAEALNRKMREIRDSGKVVGLDRIAVMAALNMAHDLIQAETKDQAIEWAKKNNQQFIIIEPKERKIKPKNYSSNFDMNRKEPWTH